jgi:hypothetical protein
MTDLYVKVVCTTGRKADSKIEDLYCTSYSHVAVIHVQRQKLHEHVLFLN